MSIVVSSKRSSSMAKVGPYSGKPASPISQVAYSASTGPFIQLLDSRLYSVVHVVDYRRIKESLICFRIVMLIYILPMTDLVRPETDSSICQLQST